MHGKNPLHSEDVIITAMCLFEAVIDEDVRHVAKVKAGESLPEPESVQWRSDYGSYALRVAMISLAYEVDKVWETMSEDTRDTYVFDFEFIPDLIDRVDWSGAQPCLKMDYLTLAKLMETAHNIREATEKRARDERRMTA